MLYPSRGVLGQPQASEIALSHAKNHPLVSVADVPEGEGEVILTVSPGNDDVQHSSIGWRSFQIENTGDKRVAAVYIDTTNAIIPDVVFDPDGSGGDDVAKVLTHDWGTTETKPIAIDQYTWTWNSVRAAFDPADAFDPSALGDVSNLFVDELSDSGMGATGGFRGQLIMFEDFVDGFTYEFSVDLDPNSLAGLKQGTAATHANWDVGGVSGAEMINSEVTVLFGDGSTASGTISSDGSQAGAIARISADLADAPALIVNGVQAGGNGVYNGSADVSVSGTPGQTVLVSRLVAFDPVENQIGLADGTITAEALISARLNSQYPEFPVNNAQEWQHVEVVIPASGSQQITNMFQDNPDDYAVAFTAVAVDTTGLPLSKTSNPIRLVSPKTNAAVGNLLINGSFESVAVDSGSFVQIPGFQVEGWGSLSGETEFWGSPFKGVSAVDGSVFMELDVHRTGGIDGIFQDVVTEKGRLYELSFYIRSRTRSHSSVSESLVIMWRNQQIHGKYSAASAGAWTNIVVIVEGSGGSDSIVFKEITSSNSLGPLLDHLELTPLAA